MTRTPADVPLPGAAQLRRLRSDELSVDEIAMIRTVMTVAFGDDEEERFEDTDWEHALGGTHVVLDLEGEIVAHAAVVERELHVAGRPIRTGYVEAVATASDRQGRGHGTRVMADVGAIIADHYELGALGTGRHRFYERLGWRTWRGPLFVRTADGDRRTPDEDGYLLVLTTPTTPLLDLDDPISCEWRTGDVW